MEREMNMVCVKGGRGWILWEQHLSDPTTPVFSNLAPSASPQSEANRMAGVDPRKHTNENKYFA